MSGEPISITNYVSHKDMPWGADLPEKVFTYLAIIKDFPDSKRLAVRPLHLAGGAIAKEKGWFATAGATLRDDLATSPDPDEKALMNGSWLLVRAPSLEDARERLGRDIYSWPESHAWDISTLQLTPVLTAAPPSSAPPKAA